LKRYYFKKLKQLLKIVTGRAEKLIEKRGNKNLGV